MAAIATTQVTLLKGSDKYAGGGVRPRSLVEKRFTITGVTAADTATAAVLGFANVTAAHSAITSGTPDVPLLVGVSYNTNQLIIGAGPAASTIHVTVIGTPASRVN